MVGLESDRAQMSILDTFYILFKTDAEKAAKDVESVGKAGDKAEAGLLKADAAAGKLGNSFVAMAVSLAAPIAALFTIQGALSLVHNRIEQIGNISDNAFKLRSTTADYDAFTRSARAAGGEMAQVQANLNMFSDKLNDAAARPDGPNAKNFNKWGIVFKDVKGEAIGAVDGLLALSKSLEGVSQAEALGRLKKLGITDADTIQFLLQGKQAILDKMEAEKRAGVVTDQQIQLEGDYRNAVGRTANLLDTFAGRVTEVLLPAIIRGYEWFNRWFGWMLDHEAIVKGFFIGIATVITAVLVPAMTRLAIATLAATWPYLAIAAAVAAFGAAVALVYEDLVAYFSGQNSLIGELIKKYQWLIDAAKEAWGQVVQAIASAWNTIQPTVVAIINTATSIIDAWVKMYTPIYNAMSNLFSAIGELAVAFKDRLISEIGALVPGWIDEFNKIKKGVLDTFNDLRNASQPLVDGVNVAVEVIKLAFETLGGIIKAIWDSTIGYVAAKIDGIAARVRGLANVVAGGGPPIAGGIDPSRNALDLRNAQKFGYAAAPQLQGANGNTQTNNVSVGAVNVNTQATDAQGVAKAVRGALANELRTTASQFDNGVDR